METLRSIWSQNRILVSAYFIFLVVIIVMLFLINKGDALLWLNRNHTPFLDVFFRNATKMGEELAFFIALIALLFTKCDMLYIYL